MADSPLEQVIEERRFAASLQVQAEPFVRLLGSLSALRAVGWGKRHHYQLVSEADVLESFLDDYGARYNRTFALLTELVASVRGLAQAGYALSHMEGRLDSYGVVRSLGDADSATFRASLDTVRRFLHEALNSLLHATREEIRRVGADPGPGTLADEGFLPTVPRQKLPRNLDTSDPVDERQKIAEVASRFQLAAQSLASKGFRRIEDASERRRYLHDHVHEEHARELEAMVHNLQSTYDTHIKNTVLESRDERLPLLRGHASAALHLLEIVTLLTHFYERHENELRSEAARKEIASMVSPDAVQAIILNHLLHWATRVMQSGLTYVQAILASYTNRQELSILRSEDQVVHARPAALIVAIVNHFGTPVELEVAGKRCNAASILEMLVTIGSHPEERRLLFRGDEKPLRDIERLFRAGLGERGLESLPAELSYLRGR